MATRTKKVDDPQKNRLRNIGDYIASGAFIVVGSYNLASQHLIQGVIYSLIGIFFAFITRARQKKEKAKGDSNDSRS